MTLGGSTVEGAYAFQDFSSVPGFTPFRRSEPSPLVRFTRCCARRMWSTSPAASSMRMTITASTLRTIYQKLVRLPAEGKATMVGYLLKNTDSLHGTVSRGVCTVADGRLRSVREALKVQLNPDGALRALARDRPLAQDTAVSMNFWGFMPSIFPELKAYFENFLRHDAGGDLKAECLLPVMVDQQMREGKLDVSILHFSDKWFGMTYQQDREIVAAELQKLHERATTLRICKNRKKEPESQHPRQLPRVLF